MPARKGHCTNFGLCRKADNGKRLKSIEGARLVCPECGQPLDTREPPGRFPWRIVAFTMAIFLVPTAREVYRWEPHLDGHGRPSTAVDQGSIILRLRDASSVGSALALALAEAFLKLRGASEVKTIPADQEAAVRVQGILPGESSPKVIEIHAVGAASTFQDLARGACDVGLVFREINPQEAVGLSQFNLVDRTSQTSEHFVALDSIAVIVNQENPIESLTKKQVSLVFAGAISDWAQAGSFSGPIRVYVRNQGSGTYHTFRSLVLGDQPLLQEAQRIATDRELADHVAQDPNGIGAVRVGNLRGAKTLAISAAGARSFLPTRWNLATGNYPLTRRLSLYTPANPCDALTRHFVDFTLSRPGQQIVEQNDLIGRNVMSKN